MKKYVFGLGSAQVLGDFFFPWLSFLKPSAELFAYKFVSFDA